MAGVEAVRVAVAGVTIEVVWVAVAGVEVERVTVTGVAELVIVTGVVMGIMHVWWMDEYWKHHKYWK